MPIFMNYDERIIRNDEYRRLKDSDEALNFLLSEEGLQKFYWEMEHGKRPTREAILGYLRTKRST